MRIRKGTRCPSSDQLMQHSPRASPLFPAPHAAEAPPISQHSCDLHSLHGNHAAHQPLPPPSPTVPTSVSDFLRLEHANGTSSAATNYLEHDLGRNRLPADDFVEKRSVFVEKDIESAKRKWMAAPANAESIDTRHTPLITRKTDRYRSIALEVKDQPNLLVQSLHHVCSASGNTGLTAREAVARIIEQGLPGLNEGGERLIVQVAKSFRNCSQFVEREERGRYFLRDSSECNDNFVLTMGDSTFSRKKEVSSSAMIQAARQLQNLQRNHLKLAASGIGDLGTVKPSNGFQEVGFRQELSLEQNAETDHSIVAKTETARNRVSSLPKVSPSMDHPEPQCNRDDGKGWRCIRPAEAGFSLCQYHRDQIRRAELRRRTAKVKLGKQRLVTAENPPSRYVATACKVPNAVKTACAPSIPDDELFDQKRRKFVNLKSIL